ncbi:MAG: hypothetical protein U1C58_07240 [Flavobacteriaceae bacterium]|nr:hypothetical protein [Flavobacteriaceae bacterium]MDZ4148061.1 hypothetical protein [Flavobacteriaceae bacterium]
MKIETQRKNIVHRILEVQNSQLLNRIEELLDSETYTYTAAGKPLSRKEYTNHLTQIMIASDSEEEGYNTKSAREKIVKR